MPVFLCALLTVGAARAALLATAMLASASLAACAALGTFQLDGCDLYTTCEPCPMCLGAIYWARIGRVFFGGTAADAAAAGFDDAFIYQQLEVPIDQRKIPFIQMMREEALACFQEWKAKTDRIDY